MVVMYRISILLLFLMAGSWSFSELFPVTTSGLIIKVIRASEGLEARQVQTDIGPVNYLEGGKGPTVVLVHGLFGNKDNWLGISNYLTDSYRVIMLDIPGFGDNPELKNGGYGLDEQAERLIAVVKNLRLDQFHLAGNSLGGQLAGMLAAKLQNQVLSLSFIGSPSGVRYPETGQLEKMLTEVKSHFLVTTREEFHERLDWLFPTGRPRLYKPLMRAAEEEAVNNIRRNIRIWKETVDSMSRISPLIQIAPILAQPTLILWCEDDRIFHVDNSVMLANAIAKSKRIILAGCGHMPMIDKPQETGLALRLFLDSLTSQSP